MAEPIKEVKKVIERISRGDRHKIDDLLTLFTLMSSNTLDMPSFIAGALIGSKLDRSTLLILGMNASQTQAGGGTTTVNPMAQWLPLLALGDLGEEYDKTIEITEGQTQRSK